MKFNNLSFNPKDFLVDPHYPKILTDYHNYQDYVMK